MTTTDQSVLAALMDSWERGNRILLNLLPALGKDRLEVWAMAGSPTIAAQFTHIQDVRLFFVSQTAPEFAPELPELFRQEEGGWQAERDPVLIAQLLESSARAVRGAVQDRLDAGTNLRGAHVAYDHPVLLLQHMLWHEGYHVGQIMLALKAAGRPMSDFEAEAVMWGVWRQEW